MSLGLYELYSFAAHDPVAPVTVVSVEGEQEAVASNSIKLPMTVRMVAAPVAIR